MADRIELDPPAISGLIRAAGLQDLRIETSDSERDRALGQAITALDALCALHDRGGTDEVWDVLSPLDRRALLTFATFAISELAEKTQYSAN